MYLLHFEAKYMTGYINHISKHWHLMELPFRKATVLLHQTTAAGVKPSGCAIDHAPWNHPAPPIPPGVYVEPYQPTPLTHAHPKQTRVEQNRVKQSRERLRLPCFIPTHRRMLHVSHAHTDTHTLTRTHTHTHDTHEARESVGGEKEVEWDSMQSGGWVKTTGIKICTKCYHRFEG